MRRVLAIVLLISLSIALPPPFASAKKRTRKPASPPKLIRIEPRFDTSVLPPRTHFELKIKHTEIVYTQPARKLLRANAKIVQLQGDANTTVLRGHVATAEDASVPINTLQHGVRARFHFDMKKLEAKLAPDISEQLDAQIAAAKTKLAGEVAAKERLMENELRAQKPHPDMPSIPDKPQLTANLTDAITKLSQVVSNITKPFTTAAQIPAVPKAGASPVIPPPGGGGGGGAIGSGGALGAGGGASAKIPRQPFSDKTIPNTISQPATKSVLSIEKQMDAVRAAASGNKFVPSDKLSGILKSAPNQTQTQVALKQPEMDAAISTHIRMLPPPMQVAVIPGPVQPETATETIAWDEWHARLADLAKGPILAASQKHKHPAGANTVEITVLPNHSLFAKIIKASNSDFDAATLEAYKSLSGNPALAFPPGSRRINVTFQIDNEHKTAGKASGVNSQTTTGDSETFTVPILH